MNANAVDSHHHFWDPTRSHYPWMVGPVNALRRRFGPEDLEPLLRRNRIAGGVLVQTRSSLEETLEFLTIAADTDFVRGVVGWVDLTDDAVGETLAMLKASSTGANLVGIRHQAHDEDDPRWLLRADVQRGLRAVQEAGLAYDLLVRTRELPAATELARSHPELRLVVDHAAKPPIRTGGDGSWSAGLSELARCDNVYCKLSGLVVEADWLSWRSSDLRPYVQSAIDWFGSERLMFGSDWPICLLAGSYSEVFDACRESIDELSEEEQNQILGSTAARFYRLGSQPLGLNEAKS